MKDIAIYGAGGFGREIAATIGLINHSLKNQGKEEWRIIGFFDDGVSQGTDISGIGKVIGGMEDLNAWQTPLDIVLCFGSPRTLKKVASLITNPNISFPNIIDPSFTVGEPKAFSIGKGNIIKRLCSATTNVHIGDFNVFNGYISIGHDAEIGDFNVFMPGVRISGETRIGECNLFGGNSFIRQGLKIGTGVTLSPVSALLSKPKDNTTYIGNPAKIFKF